MLLLQFADIYQSTGRDISKDYNLRIECRWIP